MTKLTYSAKMPDISIVIPVYNECDSIPLLYRRIIRVCRVLECGYELIFVNDGSTDETKKALLRLPDIKVVNLRKNFGQTAALDAGIKMAKGKFIITMDGDGQNDPADIPKLLKAIQINNYDCVCGWRKDRRDPRLKRIISKGAWFLRSLFIHDGIHDSGCTLKIFKRECFTNIDLYGEMHRFIPALLKIRGFKIGEIVVRHHPRQYGVSKYNWKRTIKGGLDILSLWFWGKYSSRPLHLFGGLGVFLSLGSTMIGVIAMYRKFINGIPISSSVLTYVAIAGFLTGIQLFISGLLMDMVIKGYYSSRNITNYEIAKVITNKKD